MNSKRKITFITTVFNEADTIEEFLRSLFIQQKLPDEIIIIDGGSTDDTFKRINSFKSTHKNYKGKFITHIKKGNRSVGRNEAIKHASADIILCSDSGNILDKKWIKNIVEPFSDAKVDVVAGYYKGIGETIFQKCVIPYALVMPDNIDPHNFLPATRSIAFTKKIWKQVGGFDEKLSHNEDYAFAKKLQKAQAKIAFTSDAIVYWKPRNTFKEAFIMMYRFAYGDGQARIIRPKVLFIYLRYFITLLLLFFAFYTMSEMLIFIVIILLLLYIFWAIWKNYKYVNEWRAIIILPALQLISDWAVLKGTTLGILGGKIRYN